MHLNDLMTTLKYFLTISLELVVLFVAISFLVGLIQEFIPDERIRGVLQRPRKVIGNMLGAFFGALTPRTRCFQSGVSSISIVFIVNVPRSIAMGPDGAGVQQASVTGAQHDLLGEPVLAYRKLLY